MGWRGATLSALLSLASSHTASRDWQHALRGVAYRSSKRCYVSTLFKCGYDPREDPSSVLLHTLQVKQPVTTTASSCTYPPLSPMRNPGEKHPHNHLQPKRSRNPMPWKHPGGGQALSQTAAPLRTGPGGGPWATGPPAPVSQCRSTSALHAWTPPSTAL